MSSSEAFIEDPAPFERGGARRSSRINIKEMCKKFENLPTATEISSSDIKGKDCVAIPSNDSDIPKVPLRRSKVITDHEYGKIRRQIRSIAIATETDKNEKGTSVSVRERTKIFESTQQKESAFSDHKQNKMNEKTRSRAKSVQYESSNNTPPKPPRRFIHSSKNTPDLKNCVKQRSFSIDESPVSTKHVEMKSEQSQNQNTKSSSFSFEYESIDEGVSLPKLNVICDSPFHEKPPQTNKESTPFKQFKFQNLTAKLASAANNICEKVKQTHSRIFVDLTPTTVSPPKHYGTLKRSHSEEHIYAEPLEVTSRSPCDVKTPIINNQSLHYMSNSVVKPKIDRFHHSDTGHVSVRNMIYESFSMVRRTLPVKDNRSIAQESVTQEDGEADVSLKAVQDRIIYVKSVKKQVSATSICISPKLYEVVLVIGICDGQPEVIFSFPEKKAEGFDYPLLPHICFPDIHLLKSSSIYKSETFCFSLLDVKEEIIYGYCRRILSLPPNAPKMCVKVPAVICILSGISAPMFYGKILDEMEKHLALPKEKCFQYMITLRKLGVPNAGANLSIPDSNEFEDKNRVIISRPLDSHIVGFDLTRCLQILDVDILVKAVASLLLERRVLLLSSFSSNLLHCCKALSSLLYPFQWQHLVIPILPTCLLVQCCMESPYIIGILGSNCNPVLELLAEHELLVIDVDKGLIVKSFNDEDTILPRKVQKALTSALNLSKNMTDPTEMMRDVMISEAFVHMFVEMIGHYENHFVTHDDCLIIQKEAFIKGAYAYSIRSFLQWFSETQMFEAFIAECIWRKHYRNIFQTQIEISFETRVEEYKWELILDNDKISKLIGKKVKNFGERLKGLKK